MMKHYKSFLIMFFLFSSFSLLQVMGEEEQTVVPKPFAEFFSENMKKTDGAFPVYQVIVFIWNSQESGTVVK